MLSYFIVVVLVVSVFSEATLKIEILKDPPKDCIKKAKKDDSITMHYRGTLENGKEFDSSYSRKQPFTFTLGTGMVISGWEQSIPGMCVGEKRKLTIPPSLAYGDRGFGDIIPAKSTLIFEIELINIKEPGEKETPNETPEHEHEHPDAFEALDTDGNKEISVEEMGNYIRKFHEQEAGDEQTGEDSVETIVSEIFQEDDKNKDGVISYEEYQHSAEGLGDSETDDNYDMNEEEFDNDEEDPNEPRVEL